jgi:hypothetical protein
VFVVRSPIELPIAGDLFFLVLLICASLFVRPLPESFAKLSAPSEDLTPKVGTLAAPSIMGAYSDDETSKDSQSLSSRGSGRGKEGQYAAFTNAMCGAIFTMPQTGERQYVCFNKRSCRRPDHRELAHCSLYGYWFCLKKTKSRSLDGVLDTNTSPATFQMRQEEVVASNRTSLRSYAAQQASNRSPDATTPSSHSEYSNHGWEHTPGGTGPDQEPP